MHSRFWFWESASVDARGRVRLGRLAMTIEGCAAMAVCVAVVMF